MWGNIKRVGLIVEIVSAESAPLSFREPGEGGGFRELSGFEVGVMGIGAGLFVNEVSLDR